MGKPKFLIKVSKVIALVFLGIIGIILQAWSAAALYYCSFPSDPALRSAVAIIYLLALILFIILSPKHVRAFFLGLLGFVVVAIWFNTIQPKAGAQFPPELTLPYAEIKGDVVTLHNVRNSAYRTKEDFDVHYETRTYNLKDVRTLDVLVNYWGMEAIAHTFLSYGFSDGSYLAVSVEIRPAIGQVYDMVQGFFKQYQIIYIWADERDLVRLRTNYKKENVYLYRSTFSPDKVRKMFLSMLQETNSIHDKPQFYNTLTHSCTNTLGNHVIATQIAKVSPWERRFRTGDIDQRLYQGGLLDRSLPFAELRRQANIDSRAQAADNSPQFSEKIRTHLILKDARF